MKISSKVYQLFVPLLYVITGYAQSFTGPTINPFNLDNAGGFNSPVFVAIDNDNDYDCFSGLGSGQTAYYENTGTQTFPAFADWYNAIAFGIIDVGNNAKPAFADIDFDGDFDLYMGEAGFKISFFRNTSAITPNFNYISDNPAGISGLGSNVAPAFVDIDNDGDFDLFTGQQDGNILFFRNIGTRFNPQWANPLTNPFGLSDVGSRSTPSFCDVDKDGDHDTFIGNENGDIIFFRNIGSNTNPSFASPLTNPFGLSNVGTNSAPSFVDIDNDEQEDLFIGTGTGATYYFKNTTIDPLINVIVNQTIKYEPVGTLEIVLDFKIVNISQIEQTIFEVRTINNLPFGWSSSLCFEDLVFAPEIDSIATTPEFQTPPLAPGDTLDTSVHIFTDQVNIATAYIQLEIGTFQQPGYRIIVDFIGTTDPTVLLPITVTSPNGGENWLVGSTQNISWTSSNVSNVKIEYSTNSGVSWLTVINYTPSTGSYLWTIPNTISNTCRVKISDATNNSLFDESDGNFSIVQPAFTIISPNGGENWQVGTVKNISWTSSNVTNAKIDYSTNSGNSWILIISSIPASNETYVWTIPNTVSTNCKVRISDASNPSYYDLSDNVFSITPIPSITVTSPNGGETYEGTTIESISYNSVAVDSVMIHYSSNSGTSWVLIYSSVPAGSYINWIVPNITSDNCLIKITDTEDINNFDVSDGVFSIMAVGWYKQNSNVWGNLYSIDMWNATVGYSCGDNGTIVKTTNGGQIWESLSTGIVEDLHSIKFVSASTGWVVGGNGRILKTTNGGLSWSYQNSNTTSSLSSVYFINQNTGWAVGSDGTIRKTTDSGNSWVTQQSNVATYLNSVFFYSSSLGWIVGNTGTYLKTTNGGDTWIQKTAGTTYNLYSILFTNSVRGFIVGYNGTILLSDDGGEIWTNVSTSYGNYYSISFANAETGYIVGEIGQIYKSTDGGLSWFRIGSGLQYGDYLFDVTFIDLNTGWAVGEGGTIIKTNTGGTGYATTNLIANAPASSQVLEVSTIEGFFVGDNILINPGGTNEEINKIVGFGSFLLETPLSFNHQVGETVISLNPSSIEEEIEELPKEYSLLNNYPNPFNPSTTIRYSVPEQSLVILKVYDILGNEIGTLINEAKQAGTYEVTWYAEDLPSGVYFYQVQAGSFVETKKMVLMK